MAIANVTTKNEGITRAHCLWDHATSHFICNQVSNDNKQVWYGTEVMTISCRNLKAYLMLRNLQSLPQKKKKSPFKMTASRTRLKNTCKASCWGEEDKTVVRSSILFLATSNASFVCSAVKLCTGRSRWICWGRASFNSDSDTERAGVNIGAKLSLSRPGNRMPLDFKLWNRKTQP